MSTDCQWFVVPGDANTNEVIATSLNQLNESGGSEFTFINNNEKQHQGWRVKYAIIIQLQRNVRQFNLKFEVYVKEGGGLPRQYTLHKKIYKSAKLKKVKEALVKVAKNKKADK